MEVILIVLTGAILSAMICSAFYLGYRKGKEHRDTDGIKIDKQTANVLKQYANLYTYDGNER